MNTSEYEEMLRRTNEALREAGQRASRRNRAERRARGEGSGLGPYGNLRPAPTPEHHHIVYHVVSGDEPASVPYYKEAWMNVRDAYVRVAEMGRESEPNTEWYDDGRVQIETTVHGRTGLYRILLEVVRCVRTQCRQYLPKDVRRRELLVIPKSDGTHDIVETAT